MSYTSRHTKIHAPIFKVRFSQKSHIINGSFAESDLQLKASYASPPPCSIWASFADILGSFEDMQGCFVFAQGSVADIKGSYIHLDTLKYTHTQIYMSTCGHTHVYTFMNVKKWIYSHMTYIRIQQAR